MKRLFSCSLLFATLIPSAVMMSMHVWEKDLIIGNGRSIYLSHTTSPFGKDYFLIIPDTPPVPAELNISSHLILSIIIAKVGNNPYHMLKSCFSKRTSQQLNITQTNYTILYAQKEKKGYYIYALRKLLI